MTTSMGLSRVVWSNGGDRLYSFEQAAYFTQTFYFRNLNQTTRN
ncbi:hypothetical protein [Fischerella thermalis]|jgi:chaperone modulatory protein CbpM|nr:hypothetical protein [Fischerella thermalis]